MTTVELVRGVNADGDTEYRTEDGYTVVRVEGRRPWMILPPNFGSFHAPSTGLARNLNGAKNAIARMRT